MSETYIGPRPPLLGNREWDCQCARCGSSAHWIECEECDEGFDCEEICSTCSGYGGWWECLSSVEWCKANPMAGREAMRRGRIEWYTFEEKGQTR